MRHNRCGCQNRIFVLMPTLINREVMGEKENNTTHRTLEIKVHLLLWQWKWRVSSITLLLLLESLLATGPLGHGKQNSMASFLRSFLSAASNNIEFFIPFIGLIFCLVAWAFIPVAASSLDSLPSFVSQVQFIRMFWEFFHITFDFLCCLPTHPSISLQIVLHYLGMFFPSQFWNGRYLFTFPQMPICYCATEILNYSILPISRSPLCFDLVY